MLLSLTTLGFNHVSLDVDCNVKEEKFSFVVKSCIEGNREITKYRSFKKACEDYKAKAEQVQKGSK